MHRNHAYRMFTVLVFLSLVLMIIGRVSADNLLQGNVSPTPVRVDLPTALPFVTPTSELAPTATRTPTPPGAALLEALTEANVRSQPDPESERLGQILAGNLYTVLGKYYRWYKFQYDQAAGGVGWVFDELVRIEGDETTIKDLTQDALPTQDPAALDAASTVSVLTLTPGGIETATAASAIQLPVLPGGNVIQTTPQPGEDPQLLPTFTFPANINVVQPTVALTSVGDVYEATSEPDALSGFSLPENVPPIAPIALLGLFGLLGLLVTSIRR